MGGPLSDRMARTSFYFGLVGKRSKSRAPGTDFRALRPMNHSNPERISTRCGWSVDTAAVRFMGRIRKGTSEFEAADAAEAEVIGDPADEEGEESKTEECAKQAEG